MDQFTVSEIEDPHRDGMKEWGHEEDAPNPVIFNNALYAYVYAYNTKLPT